MLLLFTEDMNDSFESLNFKNQFALGILTYYTQSANETVFLFIYYLRNYLAIEISWLGKDDERASDETKRMTTAVLSASLLDLYIRVRLQISENDCYWRLADSFITTLFITPSLLVFLPCLIITWLLGMYVDRILIKADYNFFIDLNAHEKRQFIVS